MPQIQCPTCLEAGVDTQIKLPESHSGEIQCPRCEAILLVGLNKADDKRLTSWIVALVMIGLFPLALNSWEDLIVRYTSAELPGCGDAEATNTALEIFRENTQDSYDLIFIPESYEISNTYVKDIHPETRALSCAASIYGHKIEEEKNDQLDYATGITYSIHASEDGDGGYVIQANW